MGQPRACPPAPKQTTHQSRRDQRSDTRRTAKPSTPPSWCLSAWGTNQVNPATAGRTTCTSTSLAAYISTATYSLLHHSDTTTYPTSTDATSTYATYGLQATRTSTSTGTNTTPTTSTLQPVGPHTPAGDRPLIPPPRAVQGHGQVAVRSEHHLLVGRERSGGLSVPHRTQNVSCVTIVGRTCGSSDQPCCEDCGEGCHSAVNMSSRTRSR